METIRVNMAPCEDIKTIHASQNDNEGREWGFELHNNGEKIDSSSISDQMVFKAYEGGTEQLLPENTSTPTTTPILADIQYPDGLRTDQYFTYRETPTTVSNKARIKTIKGQTLKWNQIAELGNTDTTGGITVTNNRDGSLTINGTATREVNSFPIKSSWVNGHIYMLLGIPTGVKIYNQLYKNGSWVINLDYRNNPLIRKITSSADANRLFSSQLIASGTSFNNVTYRPMVFDLTMMFGETKADEILAMETAQSGSGIAYFKSLFPLDYYPYNSGSLIPFNGNGIKTVGFNQWDEEWEVGGINSSSGQPTTENDRFRSKNFISLLPNVVYYAKIEGLMNNDFRMYYYDANKNFIGVGAWQYSGTFTTPNNAWFGKFVRVNKTTFTKGDICINISDTERNGEYEPYTSSTLSLPISTYFPNGMKSAGSVYDELTPRKAITRVGAVDLGSLTWVSYSGNAFFYAYINDGRSDYGVRVMPNILCAVYQTVNTRYSNEFSEVDKVVTWSRDSSQVQIKDTSYSTVEAFKTAMSGVYLYYELATPTETSFTTASLVTENAEIPLSNEDGVLIGKCTEQLSENPGFFDAKIKLSDGDGECYSNKIQLHVERSPQ